MKIRGLVVEDQPANLVKLVESVNVTFKAAKLEVTLTECAYASAAQSVVQNAEQPFHFAIVDLELGDNEQNGIAVVQAIRSQPFPTFVLVITSEAKTFATFVRAADAAGANAAILRAQLALDPEWSFPSLVSKIRQHLTKIGEFEDGLIVLDEHEPGMLSIIENLGGEPPDGRVERGRGALRSLVQLCLNSQYSSETTFQLSYLASGRSGATVCRVDAVRPGLPIDSYVLKIGLDRAALEHEVRVNREASRVLHQALVSVVGDVQRDSAGHSAIVAGLAHAAVPLGEWLRSGATPDRARQVAAELFGEQLARLFQAPSDGPSIPWLTCSALLRVRAEAAIERYTAAIGHPHAGRRAGADVIGAKLRAFLSDASLSTGRRLPGQIIYVRGFGDLHSRNILVSTGVAPRPVLVDASRYGAHHWGADASRLLVDLLLRGVRPDVDSLMWDDFDELCTAFDALCPLCRAATADGADSTGALTHEGDGADSTGALTHEGDGADSTGALTHEDTDATVAFIDEVVGNLSTYLCLDHLGLREPDWHWQWHVALAKEALRQATEADLPPARAAAGLVSAASHLSTAGRLI